MNLNFKNVKNTFWDNHMSQYENWGTFILLLECFIDAYCFSLLLGSKISGFHKKNMWKAVFGKKFLWDGK